MFHTRTYLSEPGVSATTGTSEVFVGSLRKTPYRLSIHVDFHECLLMASALELKLFSSSGVNGCKIILHTRTIAPQIDGCDVFTALRTAVRER